MFVLVLGIVFVTMVVYCESLFIAVFLSTKKLIFC